MYQYIYYLVIRSFNSSDHKKIVSLSVYIIIIELLKHLVLYVYKAFYIMRMPYN